MKAISFLTIIVLSGAVEAHAWVTQCRAQVARTDSDDTGSASRTNYTMISELAPFVQYTSTTNQPLLLSSPVMSHTWRPGRNMRAEIYIQPELKNGHPQYVSFLLLNSQNQIIPTARGQMNGQPNLHNGLMHINANRRYTKTEICSWLSDCDEQYTEKRIQIQCVILPPQAPTLGTGGNQGAYRPNQTNARP